MINSRQLKDNPNLYAFLPVLYLVWSDAVLTPTEIDAMRNLIDRQGWLTAADKSFLMEQLNPASPPSPDEFKSWLEEIRKAAGGDTQQSLADIGIKLAQLHGGNAGALEARKSLSNIEEALGLISREATYHFYPESKLAILFILTGHHVVGNDKIQVSLVLGHPPYSLSSFYRHFGTDR